MAQTEVKRSKILVHIYSYKERNLLNFVEGIINKSSGSNIIDIYITDQNNLTRLRQFVPYNNVRYDVIWWDEFLSPNLYIQKTINENAYKQYDYALLLKQHIEFKDGWDTDLINLLPENAVISGQGKFRLSIDKNFYIKKDKRISREVISTGFIDRNFIFAKFKDIRNIIFPYELKYYGDEEYFSIQFLNNGIDIFALPTDYYTVVSKPIHERGYIPFSLNHNYNEVVSLLKDNSTSRLPYKDPSKFLQLIGLDLTNLYKLPFDFNDIEYDRFSSLDKTGGKRYIERLNSVS